MFFTLSFKSFSNIKTYYKMISKQMCIKSKIPISLIEPNMYIKNFNLIQEKYYKSLNYLPQDKAIKYINTLNLLTSKRNKYK